MMNYLIKITLIALSLLSFNNAASLDTLPESSDNEPSIISDNKATTSHSGLQHEGNETTGKADTIISDSLSKSSSPEHHSLLDPIIQFEKGRQDIYKYDSTPDFSNPYYISTADLFRKDGSAFSDALRYHPLITSVKFGLSNSLNRFLLYGNVAPVTKLWTGPIISSRVPYSQFPFSGTHLVSTETQAISIDNNGLHALDYPVRFPSPETVLLWENGVFDENLLDLRFSRPLSPTLMLSVFSNYRQFKGMKYDHNGNDIYSFYSNIYRDTNDISRAGYNPLTDEHSSGAQLTFYGKKGSNLHLEFRYSDLQNELATDSITSDSTGTYEMIHRYPLNLELSSSSNKIGNFFWDFEAKYSNEPLVKIKPVQSGNYLYPERSDGLSKNISAAIRSGLLLRKTDSLGITFLTNWSSIRQFNGNDHENLFYDPRLCYIWNSDINHSYSLKFDLNAGANFLSTRDSSSVTPVWHVGTDLTYKNHKIRAFLEQDNIPFNTPLDTGKTSGPLLDNYLAAGFEYLINSKKAELLLGYQFISGVTNESVQSAWPNQSVPYEQPRSVFVISPRIGRINGVSLSGTGLFSDRKPYIKAHSQLSYVFHPLSTSEFIDINLGLEYWSERDPVVFAGKDDWNKAFYNLDLEIAAHIHSFRLFYKVDNILNRKFAYAPGYYSPGLTFRWGFNWFIQR